jgi:plastocyanin
VTWSRRHVLRIGGLGLAGLLVPPALGASPAVVDVEMLGNKNGSKVWFAPAGLLIRPGETIRWTNRDPGNAHTATAYHPENEGHPLRIPAAADAWNSDYLLPEQSFSVTLSEPGVYDYYCIPHEHAGMVGRVVVMAEGAALPQSLSDNPVQGLEGDPFPSVEEIVRKGRVSRN